MAPTHGDMVLRSVCLCLLVLFLLSGVTVGVLKYSREDLLHIRHTLDNSKMSGVEGSGDQSCSKDKTEGQAPNAGASSNAAVQESLEDQLRLLSKQLNTSHWQQRNTAEDWVNTNPEAAAELKQIIAEKQAAQNPPPQ